MKKNTFKKVAALSVACAMSAGLLAGCGGGSDSAAPAAESITLSTLLSILTLPLFAVLARGISMF